jgi:hypothetical protein
MRSARHFVRYCGLASILICLLAAITQAQMTPSDDAYINTASPTTNYGSAVTLGVVSPAQTTYIRFDLSSIPAGYTGANVAKASLKIYVNAVTAAGSFNVDFVNGTWSEKTITANLAPALGTTIAGSVPLAKANVHDYLIIDITSAVDAWLNGTQANDGIALVANSPLSASLDSKENTSQSQPAELDIVFSGGGTISGITTTAGSGLIGGGTSGTLNLSLANTCSANQVLKWSGSAWGCADLTGSGTVTSVGLSAPSSDFTVAGSPITTAGTLGLNWTVAPTSASTANAIVKRDSTGSFSLNNLTATGNLSMLGNIMVNRSDSSSSGARIDVINTSASGNSFGIVTATGGPVLGALWADGLGTSALAQPGVFLGAYTGHPLGLFTGNQARIYIGADGAVGIPTTSPQALLNVNQGLSSNTFLVGSTAKGIMLRDTGSALDLESLGAALYVNNTSQQPIYLNPNGIVGVGTVSPDPTYQLTVGTYGDSGSAVGLKVEGNGFVRSFLGVGGDLLVYGNKNFRIDHPTDPANKYLKHAAIESSEVLNMYTGNVRLDVKGEAAVQFPSWFDAINADYRYQLTAVGAPGPNLYIAREIENNVFHIAGGSPGMKVSWQVTCLRNDPYMKAHPFVVEEDKPADEIGYYSHPELYGQPAEKRIGSPEYAAAAKKLKAESAKQ